MPDVDFPASIPLNDPRFYPALFQQLAYQPRQTPFELKDILLDDHAPLSEELDATQIQDSASVRNVLQARELAILLIKETGELDLTLLQAAETILKENLYSLGPKRSQDAARRTHLLTVLQRLQQDKELRRLLQQITKPYSHRLAETVIRETLQLEDSTAIEDFHARRATLAAWLCYLRQNVGSCFATAPAIRIQSEQPHLLLKDMSELFATGRLRRTYGGEEYTVPFSSTWGAGDLRKPFALFQNEGAVGPSSLFLSPGLQRAFNAIALPSAEKLLQEAALQLLGSSASVLSCPEALIRQALLLHYQLTEQELQDYINRPKPMMQSGLMMHTPPPTKGGGKSARFPEFLAAFEKACHAFKGLTDNPLLRSWEFTLASFSEIKADFAKWNLYSSLGLRGNEPGGIGAELYAIIQHKLDLANRKVEEYQTEYEQVFGQIKYLEGRVQSASTEQELRYLKADYQIKVNEFHTFEAIREKAIQKARQYAHLFSFLIETYLRLFPEYFQEVYDADLHDVDVGPYDDSPAGFRLLFKHGRSNTSLWTPIKNHTQFIESLSSFFILSESQIADAPEAAGLEQDLGEIITAIVTHVRSEPFLISALQRMAAAHETVLIQDPLANIEKLEKKPWAYTSGGTMDTLVSCYYKREQKPTEVNRWVENEVELLVFLIDSARKVPQKTLDEHLKNARNSLLMHSPTHAFLLKPGLSLFGEGIRDNTYTYIWVRDQVVTPMQKFVDGLFLDREMIEHLLQKLAWGLPPHLKEGFSQVFYHVPGQLKATEFRDYVTRELKGYADRRWHGIQGLATEEIDSLLYRSLPFTRAHQLHTRISQLLQELPNMSPARLQKLTKLYEESSSSSLSVIPADQLQNIVKSLLLLERQSTYSPEDLHLLVAKAAQALGFALPAPLLFADTNWLTDYFGFVASPSTGRFELWRLDYTGSVGAPMASWQHWLNGSRQDRKWGIYIHPLEYTL